MRRVIDWLYYLRDKGKQNTSGLINLGELLLQIVCERESDLAIGQYKAFVNQYLDNHNDFLHSKSVFSKFCDTSIYIHPHISSPTDS